MGILDKIFGGGAKTVIESVGNVVGKFVTTDKEREAAKLEIEKEVNRHFEEAEKNALEMFKTEVEDRKSARTRETEFVKATGHMDYLMWFLSVSIVIIFSYMVYAIIHDDINTKMENLIYHLLGIVEGILLSVFGYYFGSSAGSRVKDMRGK